MSLAPVKPTVPPKAILFDLDDTLWPIAPVIAAAETLLHDWLATHAPRVAQQFSIEVLRQHRLAMLNAQPHFHGNLIELRRAGLLSAFEAAGEDPALVDGAIVHFLAARRHTGSLRRQRRQPVSEWPSLQSGKRGPDSAE